MRAVFFAIAVSACGAAAPGETEMTEAPAEEAAPPELTGESVPERDPCYSVDPAVAERFPAVADDLESAAARWFRWYRRGDPGESCELRIVVGAGCTRACAGSGKIGIRLDLGDELVSGASCSGHQLLLIDVLTHELGHLYGLTHDDGGIMGAHDWCEPAVPTDAEIRRANGCRGGESPIAGAYCPEPQVFE